MVKHRDETIDNIYHNEFPLSNADFGKQHGSVENDSDEFAQLVYNTNRNVCHVLKLMRMVHLMSHKIWTSNFFFTDISNGFYVSWNMRVTLEKIRYKLEENPDFTQRSSKSLMLVLRMLKTK